LLAVLPYKLRSTHTAKCVIAMTLVSSCLLTTKRCCADKTQRARTLG
jgi:hypothetical protein